METSALDHQHFQRIWSRVAGASASCETSLSDQLDDFIHYEHTGACLYARAAKKFPHFSSQFMTAARDSKLHLSRLQACRFIFSGDSCPLSEVPRTDLPGFAFFLRSRFLEESQAAARYTAAANSANEERLERAYADFAQSALRHADIFEKALIRIMR